MPATGALAPKAFWQGFLPFRAVVVASMLQLTAIPFLPFELNLLRQTSNNNIMIYCVNLPSR